MVARRAPTSAGTARMSDRARNDGRQPCRSRPRVCPRRRTGPRVWHRSRGSPRVCPRKQSRPRRYGRPLRSARIRGGAVSAAGPPWPGGAAWIDGKYGPIEEARISVLDLGVTRSDCTYDVVHVWDGSFFRLGDHLDRFAASMARLRLDPGYDRAQIEAILHGCVRHAGLRQAYVSMTCTRGRLAVGSRDLRTARSTLYCYAVPFVWISNPERQETGASLWV